MELLKKCLFRTHGESVLMRTLLRTINRGGFTIHFFLLPRKINKSAFRFVVVFCLNPDDTPLKLQVGLVLVLR